jgi:hypothetical protein
MDKTLTEGISRLMRAGPWETEEIEATEEEASEEEAVEEAASEEAEAEAEEEIDINYYYQLLYIKPLCEDD